jgi:4,5-DOPA dioxygenase extradiol
MNRRSFIQNGLLLSGALMINPTAENFINEAKSWTSGDRRMPVLFVGHGAPLYTLDDNKYTRAWRKIASNLPRPKAVVCVSAHWLTRGHYVTAMQNPPTIHDFGRMDDRLFDIQYPAPGAPELAADMVAAMSNIQLETDHEWGLDHGCWCVARAMYPDADIPFIQFSINYYKNAAYQFEIGKSLQFLRDKGVLVLCSGNIVHNLRKISWNEPDYFDWAAESDTIMKDLMLKGDFNALVNYEKLGAAVQLAIPTPDHYYPLITALGMMEKGDELSFPVEGLAYGGTSMRSVLIG